MTRGLCIFSMGSAWLLVLAMSSGFFAQCQDQPVPAEKTRRALEETISLDFTCQSLQEAFAHLKKKTKITFVLDLYALQQMGVGFEEIPIPVNLKCEGGKVSQALQKILNPLSLTYVILEDKVLITSEEMALQRQMRQRVSIRVDKQPLAEALNELGRTTAVNLIVDPRVSKEAQSPVTLDLDNAPLETTVRLLAELGGLKSVRVGNVLFITGEVKADKIRKEDWTQPPVDPRSNFGGIAVPGLGGSIAPAVPQVVPDKLIPPDLKNPHGLREEPQSISTTAFSPNLEQANRKVGSNPTNQPSPNISPAARRFLPGGLKTPVPAPVSPPVLPR